MAAKKKNSSNAANFKEFSFNGKHFEYSGRIYPERKREAGKLTITPMSLCLDGIFTVKGCSLYKTKDNVWIGGPQFKSGDEYKDYLYLDTELNVDMDELASNICELIG